MNWETGTDMYTPLILCMKQITNEDLLYNTGNSTHCFAVTEGGASPVAQLVKNLPAVRETWVPSWVGKIPWRRAWQPTPVFLPGESHG